MQNGRPFTRYSHFDSVERMESFPNMYDLYKQIERVQAELEKDKPKRAGSGVGVGDFPGGVKLHDPNKSGSTTGGGSHNDQNRPGIGATSGGAGAGRIPDERYDKGSSSGGDVADDTPEEKKSSLNLILIVAIVALVLFLLFRKK